MELNAPEDSGILPMTQVDSGAGEHTTGGEDSGGALVFSTEGHCSRMLSKMTLLRNKEHQLCDVVLKVGKREIHAHRIVLAACSSYFCAMFTNTMMESKQEVVTLADLDEDAVEDLVNFAYTAKINIHEGNVQPLLKAASILQLSEIIGACCNFLSDQLHPTNCLGIAAFAEVHGCTTLEESARQFGQGHFIDVVQCDEFVQLTPQELKLLLSSDNIHVKSEEVVFSALHRWLQHDTEREQYASEMLGYIRLPLLSPAFLAEQVYTKEVFRKDPNCMELIMNAMVYHTVPEKRPHLKGSVNDTPRKATMGTMFAIGGVDTCRSKGSIECFDARKDQWILISNSQVACRRLQFGVAVLESHIYVVGGRNGLRTLNTVDCYDPATNIWTSSPPMCSYRHGVGVGVMSGPMYAVGGHDGWSYLCSVERYDPNTKQWSYISSMYSARSTAGVGILDGKLYVVGGRDSNSCLNTVECYDPHTDRWSSLPRMSVRRGGVGVAVLFGKLYAIGGHEVADPLDSVEVYDPKVNEWTFVAPMNCARDAVAAVPFGGKVYTVGGFNGSMYLESVECYDPEKNEWTFSSELRLGRAGAGVAVMSNFFVKDLPL